MDGSDKFKKRIDDFLNEKSQSDAVFSQMLEKASKNVENCLKYIIAEVRKTGFCAFDDSEIFDMAIKYYSDDTIGIPPEIKCKITVNQPKEADLFSAPAPVAEADAEKIPEVQNCPKEIPLLTPKPVQATLTLFDL